MAKRKLTQAQISFIPKMGALGLSYRDIGEIFGVNGLAVYRHNHPDLCRKSMRRTTLGTVGPDGKPIRITGLRKRDHPGRCELSGKVGVRLAYHHWNNAHPDMGIWVAYKCHMMVELIDELGPGALHSMVDRYLELKETIEEEYNKIRAKEISRARESYGRFLTSNASKEQQS